MTLLFSDLKKIAENGQMPLDLEPYVKKLNTSRRRVTLVNNILQNVQVGSKSQIIIIIIIIIKLIINSNNKINNNNNKYKLLVFPCLIIIIIIIITVIDQYKNLYY